MALSMAPILPTKIVPERGKARQEDRREGWRRRSESNRCIEVLQTSALPLGYAASPRIWLTRWREILQGVPEGVNPAVARKEEGRLPREPARMLERETGVEPATSTLARLHSTTELFPLTPGRAGRERRFYRALPATVKKSGRARERRRKRRAPRPTGRLRPSHRGP